MKRIIAIITLSLLVGAMGYIGITRKYTIETQRQEIAVLKLEIYELKQACKLAEVLRQILPPVAKDELSLLAEKLKQEKENNQNGIHR